MSSKPRTPGIVYSALSVVLLVVLGTVAFTSRQPPPPTIAEFAPTAIEKIENAPEEQSSSVGSDAGACAADEPDCEAVPTPEPEKPMPPVIDVPRVRRCVGDPPRQIEDPQSPPCVPYWEGDNGGATYKGVTASEIRIASPTANDANFAQWAFFNKRFEFQGRKVRLIDVGDEEGCDPGQRRALAVRADEEFKVFASEFHDTDCADWEYHDELARRGVISVLGWPILSEAYMQRFHPYIWQYHMSVDEIFRNVGDWVCTRLAGGQAEHAGDPTLRSQPRKFGVIVDRENYPTSTLVETKPLHTALNHCGVEAKEVEYDADTEATIVLDMKASHVTSVICVCYVVSQKLLGENATAQGYFPEWISGSGHYSDFNGMIKTFGPPVTQRRQLFGLTMQPRQQRPENTPAVWAAKEMDPAWAFPGSFSFAVDLTFYWSNLLIASGLQLAGPNLTPETFAAGLRRAAFPNPDHAIMAGKVGFEDGDHSMTNDAAEWWWSETDRGPYPDDGAGTVCYENGGARNASPGWRKQPDRLFDPPCDSGE